MPENVELLISEDIFLGIDLQPPVLVADINEHALAHVTMSGDTASDGDLASFGIIVTSLFAAFPGRELVFERISALVTQRRELGFALVNQ